MIFNFVPKNIENLKTSAFEINSRGV